jgi:hypothetical protein
LKKNVAWAQPRGMRWTAFSEAVVKRSDSRSTDTRNDQKAPTFSKSDKNEAKKAQIALHFWNGNCTEAESTSNSRNGRVA